ncbi:hypothetical protein H0B56_10655 [Haloechinothrix sp. YIM 98757]|uniref:Secreted protein n=1 Tax=Haloechinothrix aidingensis TaxID=2752311 RepID=A0A838AA67_9PSEU|nr:hypothetical protein [Haloechinothrix aidingensis]MBA0126002.1 hypothetical protein [Haloechinothrix aidingensis]
MKRLFWFGLGFSAGFVVCRKANETARQATPAGLASNVGEAVRELAAAVGAFGADVRAGMSERELELGELFDSPSGRASRAAGVVAGSSGRHTDRDSGRAAAAGQYRRARSAED